MEFFTIGVYNSKEEDFFGKLMKNGIDTFADIRQRRGVRGAQYSFVNSRRLQQKLLEIGIGYEHLRGLSPTPEIRLIQKNSDNQQKKTNKDRTKLSGAFVQAFKTEILKKFDFDCYLHRLEKQGAKKIVLFCVEEHPEACHRSIVAEKLKKSGYNIAHL